VSCDMRLIIIDGLDGVGKDTHAQLIKQRYESRGERAIIRSHPERDNFFGLQAKRALLGVGLLNKIRATLFYPLDVLRSFRWYYTSEEYDTFIVVRYLIGTAYLPLGLSRIAYRVIEKFAPLSSYMFFLDATPEVLLKRIQMRKEKEVFETYSSLVRVRKKALRLVGTWFIIDTSSSIAQTYEKIEVILDRLDGF
jgi:dTMP kinase